MTEVRCDRKFCVYNRFGECELARVTFEMAGFYWKCLDYDLRLLLPRVTAEHEEG